MDPSQQQQFNMGSDPNQYQQQQYMMGGAPGYMGGMDPNMMMQMGYSSPQ